MLIKKLVVPLHS